MQERSRSMLFALRIAGLGVALAIFPQLSRAQDPPPGDSRLGHIQGMVTIQPAGVDGWGQADNNMPVGPGDRLYADGRSGGRAELQAGPTRTYFGPGADITLTDFSARGVEIGIASGTAFFYSDGFLPGKALYISTPNGGMTVSARAGFRVDVYPDQQSTVVTNLPDWSLVQINGGGGFYQMLDRNQSIQLTGTNPVYAQPLMPAPPDEFQHWAQGIEARRQNAISLRYVNAAMIGYADLDGAGDWQPQSAYGPVWFPRVQAGWVPYHNGHWVNRPFYGWTWVADEPWGAAPFHYGRWVTLGGRWGWLPGPREVAPVWSPAQVVFAGGIHVGGVGVSVWFPLGPGEPYKPWYPCSPHYIDQVNISNIHPGPSVQVHTTYVNIVNVTNVTYVNRTVGVTAMRQEDFAAGHPAAKVSVKIDVNLVQHIQPEAPTVRPPAQVVILHPVSRPAAVPAARPVLINHEGQQVAATANARPMAVPVKAAPPAPRPLPGRQAVGKPTLGGKPAPPVEAGKPAMAGKPGAPVEAGKAAVGGKPAPAAEAGKPGAPAAQPGGKAAPAGKPGTPAAKSAATPEEKHGAPAGKAETPAAGKTQAKPAERPETAPAGKTKPAAKPATPAEKPNADKAAAPKPGTEKANPANPKDAKKNPKTNPKDKDDDKKTHPEKPE